MKPELLAKVSSVLWVFDAGIIVTLVKALERVWDELWLFDEKKNALKKAWPVNQDLGLLWYRDDSSLLHWYLLLAVVSMYTLLLKKTGVFIALLTSVHQYREGRCVFFVESCRAGLRWESMMMMHWPLFRNFCCCHLSSSSSFWCSWNLRAAEKETFIWNKNHHLKLKTIWLQHLNAGQNECWFAFQFCHDWKVENIIVAVVKKSRKIDPVKQSCI